MEGVSREVSRHVFAVMTMDANPRVGGVAGVSPAEGVAAYHPIAWTCHDTSMQSDDSRAGGDIPHKRQETQEIMWLLPKDKE